MLGCYGQNKRKSKFLGLMHFRNSLVVELPANWSKGARTILKVIWNARCSGNSTRTEAANFHEELACSCLKFEVDASRGCIFIDLPRSCLGKERIVKYGLSTSTFGIVFLSVA